MDSRNFQSTASTQNTKNSSILAPLQSLFGLTSLSSLLPNRSSGQSDSFQFNPQQGLIKTHVQIFLDLQFKNYTRIMISDETCVSELCKDLKQKYAQPSPNMHSSSMHTSRLNAIQGDMRKMSASQKLNSDKRLDKETLQLLQKEEYALYMVNTKAYNPVLMIRKLAPNDLIIRVYQKAIEAFKKDGYDRFKLCFTKQSEIELFLKSKGAFQSQYDEENQVVSQLGKSIINNKTYERKGRLYKKSLNSDKFKERQFVLDKDQLFYYKNEKQKDKNFNLIMLSNANVCILENYNKQKHCFQIENENRKYILSTRSQYDLDQWVYAIQGQIKLSRDNKNLQDVNQCIVVKEKEIASHDMALIQKIFKPKNAIFNPVQPILLDFVSDPFLNELLPNLTKYISLCRDKDYQRHALEKSKEIMTQLKTLQRKAIRTMSSSAEENDKQESSQASQSQQEDSKRYKELKLENKIQCLFTNEEFTQIESDFNKMIATDDNQGGLTLNPRIFNPILLRIQRILKYNYLEDLYTQKNIELLMIPCTHHKTVLPGLEFNAIGPNVRTQGQKQCNIFEELLLKKQRKDKVPQMDPNFEKQLKSFIGSIGQESSSVKKSAPAQFGAIQKVSMNGLEGSNHGSQ